MTFVKKHARMGLSTAALLAAMPVVATGQVFVDDDFLAADYTTSGIGTVQDVRFNVDYSNIDVFGDGFLTINLPEAPNTSGASSATTGVFLTANNDSVTLGGTGVESFASVSPTLANLNVGQGTATQNYVMAVDVWHSAGQGVDDGAGNVDLTGTTNYSYLGINQTNTDVRIQENNNSATAGQGVGLAITADRGAGEDYIPHYGGVGYRFRSGLGVNDSTPGPDFRSGQSDNPALTSGLVGDAINDAWVGVTNPSAPADGDQTFQFGSGISETELNQFSGDAGFFTPDPSDIDGFLSDGSGVDRSYFAEAFPAHDDPLAYTANTTAPAFAVGNANNGDGVTYNRWATHRVYYIDGKVSYTIEDAVTGNEVLVLEKEINDPTDAGDDTVFDDTSDAGTAVLGFWDRFGGSIALSPEGANFVVYDNLSVSAASAGDVQSLTDAIAAYIPGGVSSIIGDFNGSGQVEQGDLDLVLQNWGDDTDVTGLPAAWINDNDNVGQIEQTELDRVLTNWGNTSAPDFSGSSVPEPATFALLGGLSLLGLRRRG